MSESEIYGDSIGTATVEHDLLSTLIIGTASHVAIGWKVVVHGWVGWSPELSETLAHGFRGRLWSWCWRASIDLRRGR